MSRAEQEAEQQVSLSPEKIIEVLRNEPGLLLQLEESLVRRAFEQGREAPDFISRNCPKFHNVEFRVEGLENSHPMAHFRRRMYTPIGATSPDTSDGQLLGSWIGRAGTGWQFGVLIAFQPGAVRTVIPAHGSRS
jgi:hypothetical protein